MTPDSTRIIYKGDTLASWFYLGVGSIMILITILLQHFNISLGFLYLSYGLFVFSVYCLGKGCWMWFVYQNRLKYYKFHNTLSERERSDEIEYTEKRVSRKKQGRRLHIYILVIGSIIAFSGAFSSERGLIMGTSIPVVLLSGIEFGVGLLTEFRLQEYLRILIKNPD